MRYRFIPLSIVVILNAGIVGCSTAQPATSADLPTSDPASTPPTEPASSAEPTIEEELPPPRQYPEGANDAANPLIGTWREVGRLACDSGEEFGPQEPYDEILFYQNGDIYVTQYAFEAYYGYRGRYSVDADSGTVSLSALARINDPPPEATSGTYRFDDAGRLVLDGVQLLSPGSAEAACGHILERRY